MTIRTVVYGGVRQDFTTSRLVVNARRSVNKVTVLPGKNVTAVDLRPWTVKASAFTPLNGGTYRIDTRLAEVVLMLPANPVDGYQFAVRDMHETFTTNPAVLERGAPDQRFAGLGSAYDQFAIDYSPGTMIFVYDAASKTWGY